MASTWTLTDMPRDVKELLAPNGVLRAGINMSNALLVSGRTPDGGPAGVSPDVARSIADQLGIALRYVTYKSPGLLAEAAVRGEWDIGLIGAEPQRAETISFTPAYAEIEATYLVPSGSPLRTLAEVDGPGIRIAVKDKAAYALWLDRNIRQAQLVRTAEYDEALQLFRDCGVDALAGLRPQLIADEQAITGSRLLPGRFMTVQQAIGVPKSKESALPYLAGYLAEMKASGSLAHLIQKHGVVGLSVAQPA